jgi:SAM-dependent methyltransferase
MVFSLGDMPLPNLLLDYPGEPYSKYPLDLFVCSDCTLAQLGATVPPEKMFTDYTFLTSCSAPFVKHAEDLVARMVARGAEFLNKNSLVVEIGSNDGYLLQHYKNRGIPVLGIDPAGPPAMNAQILHGITTLQMYFTNELAEKIVAGRGQVEVIHANNVLAHVPDVNDFVKGIKTLLKPEGVAIVEIPNAEYLTFDQIYHEHVFYFTPLSLTRLFERHGLWVTSFEWIETHGGSIRAFVSHAGHLAAEAVPSSLFDWNVFALRADLVRNRLREMLTLLRPYRIAGFGASAKATILLNYIGEAAENIEYIVDETPLKQRKFIPGPGITVMSLESMKDWPPDYLMIFCWNYAEQVMARFPEFKGRFIVPLPSPVIL